MSLALLGVNLLTLQSIKSSRRRILHTRQVQTVLIHLRAALIDAEAGQRGYLLTGARSYLEPFDRAGASIAGNLAEATRLAAGDPSQQRRIADLEQLATQKLNELRRTVHLFNQGDRATALAIFRTNAGQALMDRARRIIDEVRTREGLDLEQRTDRTLRRLHLAMWFDAGAGLTLLALCAILFTIGRQVVRHDRLEKTLREEAASQQRFIGILGHDLRNPLTTISIALAMLEQRAALPPNESKVIGRIASSAARMGRMVEQSLDLTRVRLAGGLPVAPKAQTNLGAVVSGIVEELRLAHPEARLDLQVEPGVVGRWDPDRMAQVVSNLLGNAIDHGGGAPVDVRLQTAGASAILAVHNGGPPIPADVLPRIFDPFSRGRSNGRASAGLGLGLFITAQIVRAHGGKVDVCSSTTDGTTFIVSLPSAA
jgi:signal transduction histidine kinase